MGGEPRIHLERAEDEPYQYYAQVKDFPVGVDDLPNEARETSGDYTRTFRIYSSPENRTEEGHPRMEVEDSNIEMGDQRREYPDQEYEVVLEVDLDDIEENPSDATDTDTDVSIDLSSQDFDPEADRKKHTEIQRAVRQ